MTHATTTDLCNRHTDRPAVGCCNYCDRPFCGDCQVEDVGAEEEFCSIECHGQHISTRATEEIATADNLIQESNRPILPGWQLWGRSLSTLLRLGVPYCLGATVVSSITDFLLDPQPSMQDPANIPSLLLYAFGAALAQVVLTQRHTGLVQAAPSALAMRRFLPWFLTNSLVLALSALGTLVFIIPGLYIGLRLFWADEFVLIHNTSPLQALKESWRLTAGNMGTLFHFQFWIGLSFYVLCVPALVALLAAGSLFETLGSPAYLVWLLEAFTFLVFFLGYAALHGPQVLQFYSVRARRSLAAHVKVMIPK